MILNTSKLHQKYTPLFTEGLFVDPEGFEPSSGPNVQEIHSQA